MPDQIFICYRRDDSAYVTGHINDRLRREFGEESIFTDVDRIALGVDFRNTLDKMVSECQILLAVIGEHWLTVKNQEDVLRLQDPADFVRIEIESALQRNIPVIPLLVEGTKMPSKDQLPESLKDFAFRNGTQIRPAPDFHTDIDRLIHSLKNHLQSLPKQTAGEKLGISVFEEGQRDEPDQERLSAERKLQREADDKRNGSAEAKLRVEEGEKTQHETEHRTTKAPLWQIGLLLVAGASWYYVAQNPVQVQAAIEALKTNPKTTADNEAKLKADAIAAAQREADAIAEAKLKADADAAAKLEADAAAVAQREADAAAAAKLEADAIAEAELKADADAAARLEAGAAAEARLRADAAAFISEGMSRAAVGDHTAAIQNFDDAIRLNAEPAFLHKQRGASYHALGDYEAAIKDFDEAIRLNAEDANAYYNRSASYKALGNPEAAERDLTLAAELDAKWNTPAE